MTGAIKRFAWASVVVIATVGMSGLSFAQVPTDCVGIEFLYDGNDMPNRTAAEAEAAFDRNSPEVPEDAALEVRAVGDGYAVTAVAYCRTETILAVGLPATGHAPSEYYDWFGGGTVDKWGTCPVSIDHFWAGSELGAQQRDRVNEAWNEIESHSCITSPNGGQVGDYDFFNRIDCDPLPTNSYHFQGGNFEQFGQGNVLALAQNCGSNANGITSFQIAFDAAENWNNEGSPSSNQFDFKSVAVHESMHATGFSRHFPNDSAQCSGGGDHTMCPVVTAGTTGWRSLELHDRHTLQNVY